MKHVTLLAPVAALLLASAATQASQASSFADAALPLEVAHSLARAEAVLSDRYAVLWATQSPAERDAFRARERAWLNVGRWQEKDACVAVRGADAGTACLAEVTLRHAQSLSPAQGGVKQVTASR